MIQSLHAGYGKLEVLHGINLSFHQDSFTAIIGPNGSGKSTLAKSILNLTTIHKGSIRFKNEDLIGIRTENISQKGIAYVPQRENVFTDMTVRENLLLAVRHLARDKAEDYLQEVYRLFEILHKRQNQRAGQLSGGERQMLAIALAWLIKPDLMILDEPSAGLAPAIATHLFGILKQLSDQGMTLIVVEQNARRILEFCDDAIVLRDGQVVFEGTAQECLADEETIKGYLGVH